MPNTGTKKKNHKQSVDQIENIIQNAEPGEQIEKIIVGSQYNIENVTAPNGAFKGHGKAVTAPLEPLKLANASVTNLDKEQLSSSNPGYIHTPEQFREKVIELREWINAHDEKKPRDRRTGGAETGDQQESRLYQFLTNCKNYWKYGQSWSHVKEKIWMEVFGNMRLLESQRLFNKFAEKVDYLQRWISSKKGRMPQPGAKSEEENEQYEFLAECFAFRERGCSWSQEHDTIWTDKFGNLEIFHKKKNEEFRNNIKQLQRWIMKNGRIPSKNRNDFDFDEFYLGEFLQKCRKERKSGNTSKWTPEKDQIWLESFHNYEMI
jgi:hypothetical protein